MRACLIPLALAGASCMVDDLETEPPLDDVERVVGWSPPERIAAVSHLLSFETDPAISADGLELFFISDRDGPPRIYTAARASTDAPFGPPVPVTALWSSSSFHDGGPELSQDALRIWFSRSDADHVPEAIYTATRPSRSLDWSEPHRIVELPTPAQSPNVSRDGLKLYFSIPVVERDEIYSATRPTATATWRNLRPVNRFNSESLDAAVTTARGDREAYFESDRGGALRLYRSTRAVDDPWSIPEVVEDLPGATRADVTPDGRRMVMMMHPAGGVADLYESTR
jgi:Tol biopolymer transport system component